MSGVSATLSLRSTCELLKVYTDPVYHRLLEVVLKGVAMPSEAVKGSCLCGSVRFEIKPPLAVFRYCHCSRCRKASGSAHAANIFVPEGQFAWLAGESLVSHFKLPGAKTFAVSFCTRCGTRVPHNIPERHEYLIPAGVLDGDPVIRPQNIIFWDSRAPWYVEPQALPKFAERP